MKLPEPTKEHHWLRQLTGEWTYGYPTPDGAELRGRETVRMLGDIWVICEGEGQMPDGGMMRSIMTIGFDPEKGRFTGTFVASPTTHLWIYESGELDSGERALSLFADGPAFTDPAKTVKYRDTIELVGDDERTLTSHILQDDGTWQEFMRASYRRSSG